MKKEPGVRIGIGVRRDLIPEDGGFFIQTSKLLYRCLPNTHWNMDLADIRLSPSFSTAAMNIFGMSLFIMAALASR